MFHDYFIKYGPIDFVKIVREKKKNGKENNYAFVMFKKPYSLDNLLKEAEYHTVSGVTVQCLRLLTRDELKKKNIEEQQQI
jgi:RNA recognition motif-containing protein